MREIRVTLAVLAAAFAAGAGASPALGDTPGFTLALSGPASATVGQAVTLQATGSNPPPGEMPRRRHARREGRRAGERRAAERGPLRQAARVPSGHLVQRPGELAYRWLVDRKQGARGARLRVTRALRGHRVQCSVTASNGGGSTTAVSRRVRVR